MTVTTHRHHSIADALRGRRAIGTEPGLYLAMVALCAIGCAHAPEPVRARYADLKNGAISGYAAQSPLIVEFQAGDRLPVNLAFSGEDFEIDPPRPSLAFVAKQHCFVRFGRDGIHASLDPEHFQSKPRAPGAFRVGFDATPGQPTTLDIVISGPRR
jgi:hypothetical protein